MSLDATAFCVPVTMTLPALTCPGLMLQMCMHGAGVSESIIMGMPMPTGTGLFKLRQNTVEHIVPPPQSLPLLAF